MNLKKAKYLRKLVRGLGALPGRLEPTKDGSWRYPPQSAQRLYHDLKRSA